MASSRTSTPGFDAEPDIITKGAQFAIVYEGNAPVRTITQHDRSLRYRKQKRNVMNSSVLSLFATPFFTARFVMRIASCKSLKDVHTTWVVLMSITNTICHSSNSLQKREAVMLLKILNCFRSAPLVRGLDAATFSDRKNSCPFRDTMQHGNTLGPAMSKGHRRVVPMHSIRWTRRTFQPLASMVAAAVVLACAATFFGAQDDAAAHGDARWARG
ncbi:unnamed protein product [Phytophthora lilii]|uniref:Unnamed protein product n=1 Tax=Phytophthora lilii TaxID=2077276 RepID=A0A9W6WP84_9STRA|nr:unnamed protein product [Phytophthora lilii]